MKKRIAVAALATIVLLPLPSRHVGDAMASVEHGIQETSGDVQFVLGDTYSFSQTIEVKIKNVGSMPYRYDRAYSACYLSYATEDGEEFLIPPGTRCDTADEGEIAPGEVVTLFSWSLDQCLIDDRGCLLSRPLLPGVYRMAGDFQSVDGKTTAHAEATFRIVRWGDSDCNGDLSAVDALAILRAVAGLPVFPGACSRLDDVDCSGSLDSVDALAILRDIVALPVSMPPNCPAVGHPDDSDEDGVIDMFETQHGSDPADPGSTPENFSWLRSTCWDGLDNDGDGLTDAEDLGEPSDDDLYLYGCGGDWDSDGGQNAYDNCPLNPNPDQADVDGDGWGDACEGQRWFI